MHQHGQELTKQDACEACIDSVVFAQTLGSKKHLGSNPSPEHALLISSSEREKHLTRRGGRGTMGVPALQNEVKGGSVVLVLSRKVGEKIMIGDNVELEVTAVNGKKVRIGITAPRDVPVVRSELKCFGLDSNVSGEPNAETLVQR